MNSYGASWYTREMGLLQGGYILEMLEVTTRRD